jgi:hypothetical protein
MYVYVGLVFAPVARALFYSGGGGFFADTRALQNRASENGRCIITRYKLAQRAASHICSATTEDTLSTFCRCAIGTSTAITV